MEPHLVTVFGGTGFLGRRVVARLLAEGLHVRVAARHPQAPMRATGTGRAEPVAADIADETAVMRALEGAGAAVNAVSLYAERRGTSFRDVHVEGAGRLAAAASRAGLDRLVHVSGIGADAAARSPYVRARGQGEEAVQAAFGASTIIRPGAMFGNGDGFLGTLCRLVRRLPVVPMFGNGETRLQPVCADDVAEACARLVTAAPPSGGVCEFGGPTIATYRRWLELAMQAAGRRRPLVPVPFPAWHALAWLGRPLPGPPLTEGQVALMRRDNCADPSLPGLADLGIEPVAAEDRLSAIAQP